MKSRLIPIALTLLLIGTGGCRQKNSEPGGTAETSGKGDAKAKDGESEIAATETVPVEVSEARIGDISSSLLFNSTLETEGAVEIYPEIAGLVRELLVEEGDRVEAGDVLLRLNDDELRVLAKEAEVDLERLESTFRRTQDLSERGMINDQDFETVRFDLAQARLRVETARLRLDQTTIRAPVTGVITERAIQIGARVAPGTRLFGMMRLDEMIARVFVPGRYLTSVKVGQEATLSSDFLPDVALDGQVKRISPVVDPKSGTFKVTVAVNAPADQAPPGLFVSIRIITDTRTNTVLIPKEALVYEGGRRFIFTVLDGKASKIGLEGGYETATVVEARSEVEAGTPVIILGQNGLKDGTPVRVINSGGTVLTDAETPAVGPPGGA